MSERLPETLKPFYDRALQADERLDRLEAALTSKTDSGNKALVEKMGELQSMLEQASTRLAQEQLKVKALTVEKEKQNYRVEHLVRALRAADQELERLQGIPIPKMNPADIIRYEDLSITSLYRK
ncbi:PREDICTED: uncharacterized protein LOC104802018 [Tarenaya hassleriana]|uniref:uncharacterized protein LOC104802018 n=1 Tax=Tarenaya hassleriana TaxID=28532 RepID=UPI00053C099B|nr:PREDICTED: uncharacterized protein LOC104802018 [Tarenaya hassleriana]